jgi:hypothetical protein
LQEAKKLSRIENIKVDFFNESYLIAYSVNGLLLPLLAGQVALAFYNCQPTTEAE